MDLTDQFNTQLSPEEETTFQDWAQKNGKAKDLYDYDLRGFWKENGGVTDERGHGTDKFKKPNHPTFSDESMYHGDTYKGGHWTEDTFTPGPTNLEHYPPLDLDRYFQQYEPGVKLLLPDQR